LRDKADLPAGTPSEEIEKIAISSERIKKFIEGREIIKKIVVPDKLVNIVVKG
jgi:leucyl-tRNA synthetase